MSSTDGQNQGQNPSQANSGQDNQSSQQQQQQQQLQLQQQNSQQNAQGAQNQQMQQLQVIQQPLQNQTYLQQVYNANGQPQLIMQPGNFSLNQHINPQIQPAQIASSYQVITAGKTFQPNQISSPHMLTTATTGYATIPTSGTNNQAYITIGQLLNSQQGSIIQQQGKPGEMQKVIQPQLAQTQLPQGLPQGLTWAPQFLQNSIIFRPGSQPDQQHMFIQQQQPLHNNSGSHQQFTTMPLTATGQLATSTGANNGLQQIGQQQGNQQQTGQQQQGAITVQQVQQQAQNQQSQQSGNNNASTMSLKPGQANLQPKPLQIQPSPVTSSQQQNQQAQAQAQAQQQLQAQLQNVNVTMGGQQFQMINQGGQQILTPSPQTITMQSQGQGQGQTRQLTILPQIGVGGQQLYIQQQQQQQQHQAIRPNYTVTAATSVPNNNNPQQQQGGTPTTATAPQQRPRVKKPGPSPRTQSSPNQKVMYPRPNMPNAQQNLQNKMGTTTPTGATITRVANSIQQQQQQQQPLKTINISALHNPPSLPDATLTPLMPQGNSQLISTGLVQSPMQVFATATQLPTPNISITPTVPQQQQQQSLQQNQPQQNQGGKQDGSGSTGDQKDTEKENTKTNKNNSSGGGQNNNQGEEPGDNDNSKQNKLPKAMVKPQAQVLTHVIGGYVIEESSEPIPPVLRNGDVDEPPKKKMALERGGAEMGKCEMCGKIDLKSKFKKGKRFCSSSCAKGAKVQSQNQAQQQLQQKGKGGNKKWGNTEAGDLTTGEMTDETSSSLGDTCLSSPPPTHHHQTEEPDPKKWNVTEVVDFVRSLPGCCEHAEDFAVQEIDGQALMLLKVDHLMQAIGMKLGPAIKLCAKIDALRLAHEVSSNGDQKS